MNVWQTILYATKCRSAIYCTLSSLQLWLQPARRMPFNSKITGYWSIPCTHKFATWTFYDPKEKIPSNWKKKGQIELCVYLLCICVCNCSCVQWTIKTTVEIHRCTNATVCAPCVFMESVLTRKTRDSEHVRISGHSVELSCNTAACSMFTLRSLALRTARARSSLQNRQYFVANVFEAYYLKSNLQLVSVPICTAQIIWFVNWSNGNWRNGLKFAENGVLAVARPQNISGRFIAPKLA